MDVAWLRGVVKGVISCNTTMVGILSASFGFLGGRVRWVDKMGAGLYYFLREGSGVVTGFGALMGTRVINRKISGRYPGNQN